MEQAGFEIGDKVEVEALYWAVELYNSGYGEYVWKRLRIMSVAEA
jgi:hypothetical protein